MSAICPTTAENLMGATDAVVLFAHGCSAAEVASFLELPQTSAENAIKMACELGFIEDNGTGSYRPLHPLARYLVTSKDIQKAAVLRLLLESFEPYQVFKRRLEATGVVDAAQAVKTKFGFSLHRDEIKETLINLGTFAQSLSSPGAGIYRVADAREFDASFLGDLAALVADTAMAESTIVRLLGHEVADAIDHASVISPLSAALLMAGDPERSRDLVTNVANATESYLVGLAALLDVNIAGAHGIVAKANLFSSTQIPKKIKAMYNYLGNIRNGADHGIDSDISAAWSVSNQTARCYLQVAIAAIVATNGILTAANSL